MFKELGHMIERAIDSKICKAGQKAENSRAVLLLTWDLRGSGERRWDFVLKTSLQLIRWTHPPYGGESALLSLLI